MFSYPAKASYTAVYVVRCIVDDKVVLFTVQCKLSIGYPTRHTTNQHTYVRHVLLVT